MSKEFSETHYKNLYSNLEIQIFTFQKIDEDYIFVDFNKHVHDLDKVGIGIQTLIGKSLADLISENSDNSSFCAFMNDVSCTFNDKKKRTRNIWHSGLITHKKMFVKSSCISLSDNFVLFTLDDITQEKIIEVSLQESLTKNNDLMSSIPIGIISSTLDGKIIDINDFLVSMFGYASQDEVKNLNAENLYKNTNRRQIFIENILKGPVNDFEIQVKKKDGTSLWGSINAVLKHIDTDEPFILSSFKDITQQKELIRNLNEREKDLETISRLHKKAQNLTHLGHWRLNVSSGKLTWSDEVYHIFELDPDKFEPTYENFLTVIHPDDINIVKEAFENSVKNDTPYNIIHRLLTSDGKIKYVHELAATSHDSEGKPESLGTVHDITDMVLIEHALADKSADLKSALLSIVTAVARSVELRDPYTSGHQKRVSEIASAIAIEMGLSEDQIEGIRIGSLIHDIGKLAIPAELLVKPSKLSDLEYALIQGHAKEGASILEGIKFPWPIIDIVSQHHERLDGSGYPNGLKGTEISLEARVVAVADVFEAMSAHRPYRPALGVDIALNELKSKKGKFYDTVVVDALLKLVNKETEYKWLQPIK